MKINYPVIICCIILLIAGCVSEIEIPRTGQTTVHETADDGDIQAGIKWSVFTCFVRTPKEE
jgi:hypothetical protein